VTAPRTGHKKRFHHFDGFQDRIHDFAWVLNWKDLGKPHCHIYVIGPKVEQPVKVGIAVGAYSRLAELQVGNWNDLYVLKSAWLDTVQEARKLEHQTHRALQRKHLSGEWFDVSATEAIETIEWAAGYYGIELRRGIPDEVLVAKAFDLIRQQMDGEIVRGSDAAQSIRLAKLAEFGISRSVNDASRIRSQEFAAETIPIIEAHSAKQRA